MAPADVCWQGKVSTTGDGSQVERIVDSVVAVVVVDDVVVVVVEEEVAVVVELLSQDPECALLAMAKGIFPRMV